MVFSHRGEKQSWENPFLMISGIYDVFAKYCPCIWKWHAMSGVLKGDLSLQALWVKPQFSPEAMWQSGRYKSEGLESIRFGGNPASNHRQIM